MKNALIREDQETMRTFQEEYTTGLGALRKVSSNDIKAKLNE